MKEELKGPKVDNVSVAVIEVVIENEKSYYAYLINLREDIMEGIIISSTGYGENTQTGETTSIWKIRARNAHPDVQD